LTIQLQLPLDANNETSWLKKLENLKRNLTVLFSEKLQKCWQYRYTFMVNSPLVATGDMVAHPGSIALYGR
jgi:hypothetical protein